MTVKYALENLFMPADKQRKNIVRHVLAIEFIANAEGR
jgi:hypothetical protein